MKAAIHLTPGSHAAERAARSAARKVLAASVALAVLLSAAALRKASDAVATSGRNRDVAARIAREAEAVASIEGDPLWAGTKGKALAVAGPLLAEGPRASDVLALVEASLPHDVSLNSFTFSRSGGEVRLDGESGRYEGGESLRSALSAPAGGWDFRLESNGYDQAGKVYTFRLHGTRRSP